MIITKTMTMHAAKLQCGWITNNYYLVVLLFVLPLIACSQDNANNAGSVQVINKDVSVAAFKEYVGKGNGIILDVRTAKEIGNGHIKGAMNIDFYADDFESSVKKLDMDKPIYIYCRSGGRSGKAAANMKDWGFMEVYNLEGGMTAWKKKGYEVVVPK